MSRQELTADTTFHIDPAGDDTHAGDAAHPWQHGQHAIDYILGSVDCRGFVPTIQCADHAYAEQLNVSGSSQAIFLRGNHATPRNVSFQGLQVRDHATLLFYDLATPWVIVAQNAIVDAAGFAIIAGSPPSGYHMTVSDSSKFNCGAYAIDVGGIGHVYCGNNSIFEQAGGVSIQMGWWPTINTFYKAQWNANIQIGAGVTYIDGAHVTGYQCDAENRGIIYRGGNTIPGIYGNLVGDGLIV